jgi:hypothetical protein
VCGRYTLAGPDPSVLRGRFPLGDSVEIDRRYNVAPGDDVVGVIRRREHAAEGTSAIARSTPAPSRSTSGRRSSARSNAIAA